MNQQRTNFKHGVLRVLALALITLALVAGLAVVVSADPPTALTVDASHLAFTDESGISVTSGGVITKTYDGSAAIALADVTVNKTAVGIPAGKDVTVNVTEAAWDSAAAGTRHVTVKFELDGADKDEFVIANPSVSFTGSIAPYALSWAAGNATATADYAIGKTCYAFADADLANKPAIDTAGVPATLAAEVGAIVPTVTAVTPVMTGTAGNYETTAEVTLSNANYVIGAMPVSVTINKIGIVALTWENVTGIAYGDPKSASVTAYDAANNTYDIYTVVYPANFGDVGPYTLTAELNNPNFIEAGALEKTKNVTVAPKNYVVSMQDKTVAGDGKTPYTIGVDGENLPASVKGLIVYTVGGEAFQGAAAAGTYNITAQLPVGNYTFTSGGRTVTELSAKLTLTIDQMPVAVKDGDATVSTIVLTAKDGLPANVTATAVKATDVKLPKGTKYAQSFQLLLSGAGENESYTIIIPLSYELYTKGCKDLSASSLYIYDASGNPVVAEENGYTVKATSGYFKVEGLKGSLGTFTFTIAPQYSAGGIAWWVLLIIILVLVVILLIVMFFIGRSVRKSLKEEETERTVTDPEPEEEAPEEEEPTTEDDIDLEAVAEETAEDLAETPAEEKPEEEPEAEADDTLVAAAVAEALAENEQEEPVAEEEAPAEEEPTVETIAVVADEEEAPAGIPAYLQTKNGGLLYIDTKKKPDLYAEMLDLEAAGQAQIFYRYRKSYQAKLAQADAKIGDYYSAIKNALLHYRGVRARKSWNYEAFNRGRTPVAKLIAKSKTIYLYLGIDPAELEGTKYGAIDVSEKKKFAATPSLMKIKGDRKLKFALELIEKICGETLALKPSKKPEQDYRIDYMTSEELIEAGMVKQLAAAAPLDAPAETYGQSAPETPTAE